MLRKMFLIAVLALVVTAPLITEFRSVSASSHREAPLISQDPLADNTDLYAFVSPDRPDTVTIIANYIPMETRASGPGFFNFDPNVAYNIYVDNTGDGVADVSFEFRFKTSIANNNTFLAHLGNPGAGPDGSAGGDAIIRTLNDPDFNIKQTYAVTMSAKGRLTPFGQSIRSTVLGGNLVVPPYNIGPGATPNYEANLASRAVYDLPGGIKVFAGPRDDPFFIDLGAVFDRLELRPLGAFGDPTGRDTIAGFSNHSICLQVPIEMLTSTGQRPYLFGLSHTAPQRLSIRVERRIELAQPALQQAQVVPAVRQIRPPSSAFGQTRCVPRWKFCAPMGRRLTLLVRWFRSRD